MIAFPRAKPLWTAAVVVTLSPAVASGEVPWKERHELTISPWPGVAADPERYTRAEVIWLPRARFVNPGCPGSAAQQCALEVVPWDDVCIEHPEGQPCVTGGLCPTTTPFYRRPRPTGRCSGVLVGDNRILTAGHCLGPPCSELVFVFDYAAEYPGHPLGNPIPGPGQVEIPQEDIFLCEEIEHFNDPVAPGTEPDEAFATGPGLGVLQTDYALVRLVGSVSAERVPIPIERTLETDIGDPALITGHPRQIPTKAEVQPITGLSGNIVSAPFNVLGGSSGSGVVNLATGKLIGVARYGPMQTPASQEPGCEGLYDLCFGCSTMGAQATLPLASVIPAIGLQVGPGPDVDHYGPPGDAGTFPGQEFSLSVPTGSREVDWSVSQEGVVQVLEVRQGPSSGTLQPGTGTSVVIGPAPTSLLDAPGLVEATMPFFDAIYGTRTPIRHRVHVGVDGFTVAPTDRFAGPEGLGVPHGSLRTYRMANRWGVPQPMTVRAYDPEDPQQEQWPQWLTLDGARLPISVTLPCPKCGTVPIELAVDGTAVLPDTYEGRIVFSSDDSGYPPFEITTEVYFDHCREIFADTTLPIEVKNLPPEESHSQPVLAMPTGGTIVDDVDMIVELGSVLGGEDREFAVYLASPDGTEVELKRENDPFQRVYDDTTSPPPGGALALEQQ